MATIKGIGYNATNVRNQTAVSGDTLQVDGSVTSAEGLTASTGGLTVSAGGAAVTGGTTTDTLTVSGDAAVAGDLTVSGDIISRGAVDLVVQDNFIDLNFANSSTDAESGGLTIQMNRTAGFVAGVVTTFVAGVASTSNPTFTLTDDGSGNTDVFVGGDVVVIANSTESGNDGLFVVESVDGSTLPQVVTIKGVGTVGTDGATPWAQTQFESDTLDTATAFKTDIFIQLVADGSSAFTDASGTSYNKGTFLTSYQTAATEAQFAADGGYTTVESTLQSAYNGGNTITTASSTDIGITLASGNFNVVGPGKVDLGLAGDDLSSFEVGAGAIDFNATAAVSIDSTGAGISLDGAGASNFTTSAGALTLSGVGLNLAGGNAEIDVTTTGALDLNSAAFTLDATTLSIDATDAANFSATGAALTVSTITSGTLAVTSAAALDLDGVAVTVDASGGLSLDGAGAASNLTSASQDLTVATTTSGTLAVSSAAALDIDGVAVTIDSSGAMDITAADGQVLSVNHGGGSALEFNATGQIDLTAEAASAINVIADGAGLTLATVNSGEVDITSAGLIDMNAGASLDIDVTGTFDMLSSGAFSIDGTGNSDIGVASGNLSLATTTSGNIVANAAGGLDFDAAAASDISVDGAQLTLQTVNSGLITVSSVGTLNLLGDDTVTLKMDADVDSSKTLLVQANNTNAGGSAKANISIDADDSIGFIAAASDATVQTTIGGVLKLSMSGTQSVFSNKLVVDATAGLQVNGQPTLIDSILDEDTLVSNDENAIATQQSIKAYVDNRGANNQYSSLLTLAAATGGIVAGNVVALALTGGDAGKVIKADADASDTCQVLGIALNTGNAGDVISIAQIGKLGGFSGLTAGNKLYVDTATAGAVTATAPSGTGDVVYQIGYAQSANEIIIMPQFIMELG